MTVVTVVRCEKAHFLSAVQSVVISPKLTCRTIKRMSDVGRIVLQNSPASSGSSEIGQE